jgi:hypothetical protein
LSISELNIESALCIVSAERWAVISSTIPWMEFTFELSSTPCRTVEAVAGTAVLAGDE